jgi:hypothetical protein
MNFKTQKDAIIGLNQTEYLSNEILFKIAYLIEKKVI